MNDENQQDPNIELQDLEQAFKEEASVAPVQTPNEVMEIPTPANKNSFSTTKLTLQETDTRLKTKIQNLKNEASDGLKKLKDLKNTIAQKIADIKELEETREKIKKELEKITSIEQEVSSIKEEAENELA
jgi:chromosome segregation ATPase